MADWCYTVPGSDCPPLPHPDNYPTDDEIYDVLAGIDRVWESALAALAAVPDDTPCPHDSQSGDEGPIATLGRWPKRWRCDGCGKVLNGDA
jgi:hypothetical protein